MCCAAVEVVIGAIVCQLPRSSCARTSSVFCSSHALLLRWLRGHVGSDAEVIDVTLPGKKWHWRLRASSTWAAQQIPSLPSPTSTTLMVSSMTNLAELLALRPDLQPCRKVYYMHENQLVYPAQKHENNQLCEKRATSGLATASATPGPPSSGAGAAAASSSTSASSEQRIDFQYGWAQLLSCLTSDIIAWNSVYNLESYLTALPGFLKTISDAAQRPNAALLQRRIRDRSIVLYLPVDIPATPVSSISPTASAISAGAGGNADVAAASASFSAVVDPGSGGSARRLRICWNHRWEYDKNPQLFFDSLSFLMDKGLDFEVVLLGEKFAECPPVFAEAHALLAAAGKVAHWGFLPDRQPYLALLSTCDVVVSTAIHEFFGLSICGAVALGCYPLCPADLAYPEILSPTAAEADHSNGGGGDGRFSLLQRIQSLTAARAPPVFPLPLEGASSASGNTSDSGKGGGRGSGRGANYKPAPRQSPFLYSTPAQLRSALADCARFPDAVRSWRGLQRQRMLEQAESPTGHSVESDVSVSSFKRTKLDDDLVTAGPSASAAPSSHSHASAKRIAESPLIDLCRFATATLLPLYKTVLLHGH